MYTQKLEISFKEKRSGLRRAADGSHQEERGKVSGIYQQSKQIGYVAVKTNMGYRLHKLYYQHLTHQLTAAHMNDYIVNY